MQDPEPALFRAYPELRAWLPRRPIVTGPTPVEPLPLAGAPEGVLFVKRDERCSPLYGGNKPRKLEFILGAALARGSRRLVTTGGLGTHHGLATTILARDAGLRTTLVLVMQPVTAEVQRSLLLHAAWGAELRWGRNLPGAAAQVLRALAVATARGERPLLVPTGGSSASGQLGFVSAGLELAEQVRAGQLPEPAELFVAVGTGGTLAGLVAGLALAGLRTRVVGVLVTDILPPSPRSWRGWRGPRCARCTAGCPACRSRDFRARFRFRALAARPGLRRRHRARARGGRGRGRPRAPDRDDLHGKMSGGGDRAAAGRRSPRGPMLFWNTFNAVDVESARPHRSTRSPCPGRCAASSRADPWIERAAARWYVGGIRCRTGRPPALAAGPHRHAPGLSHARRSDARPSARWRSCACCPPRRPAPASRLGRPLLRRRGDRDPDAADAAHGRDRAPGSAPGARYARRRDGRRGLPAASTPRSRACSRWRCCWSSGARCSSICASRASRRSAPPSRTPRCAGGRPSRLPLRRTAFLGLRNLCFLGWYSQDEIWGLIGYEGPLLPARRRAGRRLIESLQERGGDLVARADVCVIGSGAGGAVVAARARRGGPRRRRARAGRPLDGAATSPSARTRCCRACSRRRACARPWTAGSRSCRGATSAARRSTTSATPSARPTAILRLWREEHALAELTDEALAPSFARVEADLQGEADPRGRGERAEPHASARARRSSATRASSTKHNREGCVQSGYCILGCSYDAKQSMLVTYVPARRAGRGAHLRRRARGADRGRGRPACAACSAASSSPTARARGSIEVEPRVVVLAAGAVASPDLLLRSGLAGGGPGRAATCTCTRR